MIPVLACPVLVPGKVGAMLASVDVPVGRTIVIAQGSDVPEATIRLPHNIGVAAAWNLAIKCSPWASWWAIVNDDLEFAPGDLARLVEAMADSRARVVTLDGFSAFGINREAVERVGFFDENYHPAYVEDCDYEYRCKLTGVPMIVVQASLHHERSYSVGNGYREHNARTHPENNDYHVRKWGGPIRGGETLETPFGAGASPDVWTLSLQRLRLQSWTGETETMALTGGETR
jgi:hypothetical protein